MSNSSSNRNSNHNINVSQISIDDSQAAIDELPEYPDSDTFRILIVTDTHLGHLERDDIRRYDSFRAFDEALSIGKQYNVDFVLHAGDLFDKNQPSRFCMVKTLQILKKHALGNKPIHFQIVSDQTQNFPSTGRVNYEDPNYNISLPIFIQHGTYSLHISSLFFRYPPFINKTQKETMMIQQVSVTMQHWNSYQQQIWLIILVEWMI